MRLNHLHLPGLSHYTRAASLQQQVVSAFLASKADQTTPAPFPTVLTAEFHPVYTCGRREAGSLSESQEAHLRRGGLADFHYTSRGGQTTFHGPGQLVAYPIIDLKTHGLTPRCYINLLEEVVIQTCARYGVRGYRTDNPGVWTSDDEKVCAVGVHLRRNITSHGIGLNVNTDLNWFNRIVACGLQSKRATSLVQLGVTGLHVGAIAIVFVEELAGKLKDVLGVSKVEESDVPQLVSRKDSTSMGD